MPWDVAAANDEAGALNTMNRTTAGLDSGWLRTQQAYGLEGPWADFNSNPYSQAALLQRSYDNAQRGSRNSYAAQGQLYAGSLVNARGANTHQFDLGRDELQKAYAQAGAEYRANRVSAEDEYREAQNNAAWDRIDAGLDQELEPEAAPEGRRKKKKKRKRR